MIESITGDICVSETPGDGPVVGAWYELRALLIAEEDGEFSIVAMNLPGVASQGANRKEAIVNLRDAFYGAKEAYQTVGESIPWVPVDLTEWEEYRGTEIRILVNA